MVPRGRWAGTGLSVERWDSGVTGPGGAFVPGSCGESSGVAGPGQVPWWRGPASSEGSSGCSGQAGAPGRRGPVIGGVVLGLAGGPDLAPAAGSAE